MALKEVNSLREKKLSYGRNLIEGSLWIKIK